MEENRKPRTTFLLGSKVLLHHEHVPTNEVATCPLKRVRFIFYPRTRRGNALTPLTDQMHFS